MLFSVSTRVNESPPSGLPRVLVQQSGTNQLPTQEADWLPRQPLGRHPSQRVLGPLVISPERLTGQHLGPEPGRAEAVARVAGCEEHPRERL